MSPAGAPARRLPPVAELATLALALVVVGGVFMASYAPRPAPLAFPVVLTVAAGGLLGAGWILLARLRPFPWAVYWLVFRWSLLAYTVIAGMIEYVFVYDDVAGRSLALLTIKLVLFALAVPTIIAYTVARHQHVEPSGAAS